MKRFLLLSVAFMLVFSACSKANNPVGEEPKEDAGFVVKGWNGEFVAKMAGAYEYFVENNKMPATINVEGLNYGRGAMMAAGSQLLKKIVAEPETWQDEDVDFLQNVSCPDNEKNNTLDLNEMTMEQFLVVVNNAYAYAEKNHVFPNYCTVDANHSDPDGSVYATQMVINAIYVTLARIFDHYVKNNELPQTFNVWHSDYLRSTANCPIDNELVVSTMQAITAGKKTDREKAEALFIHALDEWDWVDYMNTGRGAVKTIQNLGGNCCDLSHALVAMSRAAGIPARYRHAKCKYKKSGSLIGHVMAELYVDGKWYLCDPSSSGTTFGNHEAWSVMNPFHGYYNELPF